MKGYFRNNYLLAVGVLVLVVLCFLSVNAPMRFDRQRAERERAVKRRLITIRTAEERYRKAHGVYAGSFDELKKARLLADSLRFIPFSDRKTFALTATTIIGKSGQEIPLMECSATYDDYLQGLDANQVAALTEEANTAGRFPGLKIGDIAEPNDNAGNWE